MSGDDDSEKSHEPSAKKLEDARKKGEIARSTDVLVATGYAGILLVALALGRSSILGFGDALIPLIDHPELLADDFFSAGGTTTAGTLMATVVGPILPWVLFPAGLVVAALIAMRGLLFTPDKLSPKLSRLSLIENAKNKFGRRGLFEFAKSFVKLVVYSLVLAVFLGGKLEVIAGSLQGAASSVAILMGRMMIEFMAIVVLVAALIGAVDFLWQKQEHIRKNRMSHKELRDEYKEAEGDPAMKQQRRARAQEIALNQMMADVPNASVIVVNPTHYAVALKWDRASGSAPVCLAKGVDEVAARIREVARDSGIPIHSDPATARSLYASVEIGQQISPDQYRPVAAAIRFAEDMRRRAKQRGW